MILYLDSSSILSLYLREGQRPIVVRDVMEKASGVVASPLALVEVRSSLARARYKENPPRLTASAYTRILTAFGEDWPAFHQIVLDTELINVAGNLAESHQLRAYDAVHLASALYARNVIGDDSGISTWDRELAAAATAEGLSLAHEVTT